MTHFWRFQPNIFHHFNVIHRRFVCDWFWFNANTNRLCEQYMTIQWGNFMTIALIFECTSPCWRQVEWVRLMAICFGYFLSDELFHQWFRYRREQCDWSMIELKREIPRETSSQSQSSVSKFTLKFSSLFKDGASSSLTSPIGCVTFISQPTSQ